MSNIAMTCPNARHGDATANTNIPAYHGVTIGETGTSCTQGQYGDTIDNFWLEVHQQTYCPKIGS